MRTLMNRFVTTVAVLSMLLAGMPVPAAHAAGIVVNTDTDPGGLTGLLDGKCSLREAVSNANNDNHGYTDCAAGSGADTITFASTYTITLSLGELLITSPITIVQNNSTVNYVILQPSGCSPVNPSWSCPPATWRVFDVGPGGNLTLNMIRVRYGSCAGACPSAGDSGGGIYVNGGSLNLVNSSVVVSSAGFGGGIANEGGTVTISGPAPVSGTCVSNFVGNAASVGGGIYSDGGTLQIDGACFSGNQADVPNDTDQGGGMYTSSTNATLAHVSFDHNDAHYGSGMFNAGGTLTLQNARFYANTAYISGGAIYNQGTNPSMDRVDFDSNGTTTNNPGGAIYNDASSPSITNSLFRNNAVPGAGGGGGIYNTNGSAPSLTSVTFSGNKAGNGGAIYNNQTNPTLMNVTLSGNTAAYGGGLYNFSSTPSLTNVILWGDTGTTLGNEMYNLFSTPVIDHSVVSGTCPGSCANIITADPMLGALASNGGPTLTMALGAGSSAQDSGTNSGCPSTDQRGVARPQGDTCDIGAYEVDYFAISGNAGIAGAHLDYVNNGSKTAIADGSGNYSLSVPRHWNGTVTPTLSGYAFSPTSRSYSDVGTNQTAQNYSATLVLFTISGGTGVAYTSLSYPNGSGGTLTAYADADGNYAFTVPMGWSGTVTPYHFNCTFTPADRTYDPVNANATGQDYTPTCGPWTYLISGNAGVAGAVMQTGTPGLDATADSNGDYSLYVTAGWSGTITPSKQYCTFLPTQRSYSLVGADMPVENYVATCHDPGYIISGNAGAPGATLSYTDGTAKTVTADDGGKYSLLVSPNWSGTVTPSKAGCSFIPPSQSFSNVVADTLAAPFFATCSPATVLISGNAGTAGATLSYNDGVAETATADASGNYGFFVPQNWSGTVTPSKAGCTFTPSFRTYSGVLLNLFLENYTATCTAFTISGNAGLQGVTLSYDNGGAQTASTDGNGDYSFLVPMNWSGTVTPSADSCTFTPAQRSYSMVSSDTPIEDYTPSCTFTISGNAGIAGASLDYYDGGAKTATADGSGNYAFNVGLGWTGTVIPSLTGYTFTPAQRVYSAVKGDQPNQDYSASPIPLSIAGNAGIADAMLSYDAGGAQSVMADSGGDYTLTVPYGWSGTVTPSKTGCTFTPTDNTYSNLTTDLPGEDYSPTCVAPAEEVFIAGNLEGTYNLPASGSTRQSYPGVNDGPVQVMHTTGNPLIAALRVLLKTSPSYSSYTEVMGLPASKISDSYIFPWYNNASTGHLESQLRFGNVGNASTTVTVTIAGTVQGTYPLNPSESTRVSYPNLNDGPVVVSSSGGVPIIAAMRINLQKLPAYTSYAEFMGVSSNSTPATAYMFPWYNNATNSGLDSQLRFGNVGSSPTTVTVKVGGVTQGTYNLNPSQSTRISYANLNNGSVEVDSSGGVPVIASMRVNLKTQKNYTSYAEFMGLSTAPESEYVFPWYNDATNSGLDSQLRFGNVGNASTTITVTIGGAVQGTYPLSPNQSLRVSYPGVNNGPVDVSSSGGVPIIAAMRVNLKHHPTLSSYSEFIGMSSGSPVGLPGNELGSSYLFPWYNDASNSGLDSQLRFGLP